VKDWGGGKRRTNRWNERRKRGREREKQKEEEEREGREEMEEKCEGERGLKSLLECGGSGK